MSIKTQSVHIVTAASFARNVVKRSTIMYYKFTILSNKVLISVINATKHIPLHKALISNIIIETIIHAIICTCLQPDIIQKSANYGYGIEIR